MIDGADGLRERKKARTREAIIAAALDLFESRGFEATTVEEIAAAAEVSPRTFFRYFESKLDLIMARSGQKQDGIGPRLAARPRQESLLDAMREVISSELNAQLEDPLVRREFQVMLTEPSLRALARDHFYEEQDELVGAVADRLGLDRDDLVAHVTAGVVATAIWVTVNRWIAEGAELDALDVMLDQALALLASGVDAGGRTGRSHRSA